MYTKQFAEHIHGLSFEAIPPSVTKVCKAFVFDTLGVALAGSEKRHGEIAARFAKEFAAEQEAHVVGYGYKTSCQNAAFANGVMAHAIDFDDAYAAGGVHVGCVIIPTALALAETLNIPGKEVITSIVAGYDVSCRVAAAIFPMLLQKTGYHITGIANGFGAAAVAGRLLQLSQDEMVHALGLAGDQASGLRQYHFDGTMLKHFHAGKTAQNGIFAALLAQRGFTGSPQILEGEMGFCEVLSRGNYYADELTKDLGKDFRISKTSFKPWPSCRHTHPTIESALSLRSKYKPDIEKIQKLTIRLYARAIETYNKPSPETSLQALLSLQYCLATALVKGNVTLNDFWSSRELTNPKVRALMEKIELVESPELTALSTEKKNRPTEVYITMKGGKTFSQRVDYPLGDPENPISDSDLINKFKDLSTPVIGHEKAVQLLDSIQNLDAISDIKEVMSLSY